MYRLLCVVLVAGCETPAAPVVPEDAYVVLDAPAHAGPGRGGGLLAELRFAVVGDTRPANLNDTAGYPTDIVRRIWTDVEAEIPKPTFAVTTGDYMFASTNGIEVGPQLDLYLGARATFSGVLYPTLGNHECTGYTISNCGPGTHDGYTPNYTQFIDHMLAPIGETKPYFVERFAAQDGSWTAKFVFIAANAWTDVQAQWLDLTLAEPTTYTFAMRHEAHYSNTAPGVDPSAMLLAKHPLTMLIVGHSHTYQHIPAYREIIVGNGGAPLTSNANYGYVIVARQPDGTIQSTSYDYLTHAVVEQFTVAPNGLAP
ncbi:MAG: hypothetical protein JWO36_5561 [Myxococcales bacterium]|nr:hypothetical protein [Myxococcales bacterium]